MFYDEMTDGVASDDTTMTDGAQHEEAGAEATEEVQAPEETAAPEAGEEAAV